MSWNDQLEEKKQQAERLMRSLPGTTDVMWMFLNGSDLPEKESKELWDYIDSLKEVSE
ncbi:hypothetical protein G15_2020 [Enterococcus avium]|nr:hypothetical protein G15_2020 [Enterococcus avium]